MKKILFLADAQKFNAGTLDFASFLCRLQQSSLTGVFVESTGQDPHYAVLHQDIVYGGVMVGIETPVEQLKEERIRKNIAFFENSCINRGLAFETRSISAHALEQVLLESRYADLILIDPAMCFDDISSTSPNTFVRKVLAQSECPAIIMPEHFTGLEEIIFAFDGSPSSVFAIRQFTLNFPQLAGKPVSVVTANAAKLVTAEEKQKMQDWLERYYRHVSFHTIEGESRSGLLEYVLGRENAMVIMGAYGRGTLSSFFSSSHADRLARYASKALFISHP
ncbi:universal stress protein [Chitinophaga lutea]|uniref:Universal stress protein n=1 Tax=Chitinophaga lutea TaxID=2488634 RepID=A0A3N4PJS9_9BACT|nr:universal stress protein [Chitinophaga lutea]RPE08075.1 universal stress protein [Chitinophaga lutea]